MDNVNKNETIWHFSLKKQHLKYVFIVLITIFVTAIGTVIAVLGTNGTLNSKYEQVLAFTDQEKLLPSKITRAINKIRLENGLKPLEFNVELTNAAQEKSNDMKENNYWSDVSPDGTLPWKFISDTDYKYIYASFLSGKGYDNVDDLIKAWMENAQNKKDILSENFDDIGIYIQKADTENTTVSVFVASGGVPTDTPTKPKLNTQTFQKKTVTSNDPTISCTFTHLPSKQMPKSQCNLTFECQIGSQWYLYTSRDQCAKDQKSGSQSSNSNSQSSNSNTSNSNRTPVFISSGGYTINCPTQNVGAVMSIDSKLASKAMEWAQNYNKCADNYYNTESCNVSCKNALSNDSSNCTSTYGYTGEQYDACYKNASDKLSSCIKVCPDARATCDYVYAEQKSLRAQIENLCK